ncbi:hypothetical protein DFH06DRAFT_598273 [Mycena polygramma]|nr:hypothetical protein DFH06DRAFT_598273 [Mycena polygramma]
MSFTSTSTTSLASTTTVSSRTPLTRPAPQKDFQAAFANLQSTYGFGGSVPSPVPKQQKSPSSKRSTKRSPTAPAPATDAPRSSLTPTKNFQAAFADLQSTFGFGSAVPSPVPKQPKKQ